MKSYLILNHSQYLINPWSSVEFIITGMFWVVEFLPIAREYKFSMYMEMVYCH